MTISPRDVSKSALILQVIGLGFGREAEERETIGALTNHRPEAPTAREAPAASPLIFLVLTYLLLFLL
jgi:hypothetical protein